MSLIVSFSGQIELAAFRLPFAEKKAVGDSSSTAHGWRLTADC